MYSPLHYGSESKALPDGDWERETVSEIKIYSKGKSLRQGLKSVLDHVVFGGDCSSVIKKG